MIPTKSEKFLTFVQHGRLSVSATLLVPLQTHTPLLHFVGSTPKESTHKMKRFSLFKCLNTIQGIYNYNYPFVYEDEKAELASKLLAFGVSLRSYIETPCRQEITPRVYLYMLYKCYEFDHNSLCEDIYRAIYKCYEFDHNALRSHQCLFGIKETKFKSCSRHLTHTKKPTQTYVSVYEMHEACKV